MNNTSLWDRYKQILDPYENMKEEVSLTDIFNFFDTNVLEEFLEFLGEEYE